MLIGLIENTHTHTYTHTHIHSLLIFSLLVRSSFLKTGVLFESFILGGNLTNSNDLLNFWYKIGVKMSILSLTIFVGMPKFCEDLEQSRFFNSFLFYFIMLYVTKGGSIVFIFIMAFN